MSASRRPSPSSLPLALLLVATACGPGMVAPDEADPRLRTAVVPAGDWVRVERPRFSFLLPPGYEKLDLIPIDSDAAAYALGSSSLSYDYGWYTGPWTNEGNVGGVPVRDVVRERVRIGGRPAEVVAFRYGSVQVVRAWWERVASSHGQDEHLMMRIETDDPAERARLLAALYSVRFD